MFAMESTFNVITVNRKQRLLDREHKGLLSAGLRNRVLSDEWGTLWLQLLLGVATLHADIDEIPSVPHICSVFVQKTSKHQGAFPVIRQQWDAAPGDPWSSDEGSCLFTKMTPQPARPKACLVRPAPKCFQGRLPLRPSPMASTFWITPPGPTRRWLSFPRRPTSKVSSGPSRSKAKSPEPRGQTSSSFSAATTALRADLLISLQLKAVASLQQVQSISKGKLLRNLSLRTKHVSSFLIFQI